MNESRGTCVWANQVVVNRTVEYYSGRRGSIIIAPRGKMNIFFDMDYTIIEIDFGGLRPGVKEVFERLRAEGHTLYIWSGAGIRTEEVELLGLQDTVSGVFQKPWERYEKAVNDMLTRNEIPVLPDLVVDDTSAIVTALGGVVVQPYGVRIHNDHDMEQVYRIISEYASDGHSIDSAFRPKPPYAAHGG